MTFRKASIKNCVFCNLFALYLQSTVLKFGVLHYCFVYVPRVCLTSGYMSVVVCAVVCVCVSFA